MDALHACLLFVMTATPAVTIETPNFIVTAPTPDFARQVAHAAEIYRRELAVEWLGREMPNWDQRCPIFCKVGEYGAGGATSFNFENGHVFGWRMNVQGTEERILDSVLPHEVNHTIFASHFRRPLPRWADEGAATLIEHESERLRLKKIHEQVMRTTRKIPLEQLLPMREYPSDTQQVLTLYAEGYSLADYLIQRSNKHLYLQFLSVAMKSGWTPALKRFYNYSSIADLERDLDGWVLAGSPALVSPAGQQLALVNPLPRTEVPVIRAQSESLSIDLGRPAELPLVAVRSSRELEVQPATVSAPARGDRRGLETPVVMYPATRDQRRSRDRLVAPALVLSAPADGQRQLAP